MPFRNRKQAGAALAEKVAHEVKNDATVVVIALSRSSVPIAFEVAKRLKAPLDVLLFRRTAAPWDSRTDLGVVAESGQYWINPDYEAHSWDMPLSEVEDILDHELQIASTIAVKWRQESRPVPVSDRTVCIVDDGAAPPAFLRLARATFEEKGAKKIIFASPVCMQEDIDEARTDYDEVIYLEQLPNRLDISAWYDDFEEVPDAEVISDIEQLKAFEQKAKKTRAA